MKQNYTQVPNIISGKDLDYLSDMFDWNYGAYKKTMESINSVTDSEIISLLERASNVFYTSMTKVLNIINAGGNNE